MLQRLLSSLFDVSKGMRSYCHTQLLNEVGIVEGREPVIAEGMLAIPVSVIGLHMRLYYFGSHNWS